MARSGGKLRIALAQINTTVGEIEGNVERIGEAISEARARGAQLVVLPELAVTGYPPEDLLLKRHFLEANRHALSEIASGTSGIAALVGFADTNGFAHNALAILAEGELHGAYSKMLLPNYGVFDERRYFEPGTSPGLIEVNETLIGLTVCEDVWFAGPPAAAEVLAGASLVVNASASPYHRGKGIERERDVVARRAEETGATFALCNAVGGQDELVFDGHSVVVSEKGETLARAAQFEEEILVCDLDLPRAESGDRRPTEVSGGMEAPMIARIEVPAPQGARVAPRLAEPLPEEAEIYEALKIGLRDYVEKNGFGHVVLALSGGIDSALVALVAADALGPARVTCVVMPSPHSSEATQADARRIARNLGVELIELPITHAMESYEDVLGAVSPEATGGAEDPLRGAGAGLAAENIQARIRGNLVMALSNRYGWLVLTTGNKSELSVGYATLYGDMAGGFAVIKDVFKTLVYRLVRYRCGIAERELVPESVLDRPPSAELRPGQRDEDSLPPYEILDSILEAYVERDRGRDQIVDEDGLPEDVVEEVIRMVDRAEYKRRQAPPGIKITTKAFGRDRRLPITNRFTG